MRQRPITTQAILRHFMRISQTTQYPSTRSQLLTLLPHIHITHHLILPPLHITPRRTQRPLHITLRRTQRPLHITLRLIPRLLHITPRLIPRLLHITLRRTQRPLHITPRRTLHQLHITHRRTLRPLTLHPHTPTQHQLMDQAFTIYPPPHYTRWYPTHITHHTLSQARTTMDILRTVRDIP